MLTWVGIAQPYENPFDKRDFSETKYELDTLVKFQEGTKTYDFVFFGKSQGFFWDTISDRVDCDNVEFNLLNNSKDTIFIKRVGGGDGAMLYHMQRSEAMLSSDYPYYNPVFPNQKVKIRVKHYSSRYKFSKALLVQYHQNDTLKKLRIQSWGYFIEDYPYHKLLWQQQYKDKKPLYHFKFSITNQNFMWGEVYKSTFLDSITFVIHNDTGEDIYIKSVNYQNMRLLWSASKELWVKKDAFYEVHPKFTFINEAFSAFDDPLIIEYETADGAVKKLIIKSHFDQIHEAKSQTEKDALSDQLRNRKAVINGRKDIIDLKSHISSYDFANIIHGLEWGEFHQDRHYTYHFQFKNGSADVIYFRKVNVAIKNFELTAKIEDIKVTNKDFYNIPIQPGDQLEVTLEAKPTTQFGFKFPFHLDVLFYQNEERKQLKIINSGEFIYTPKKEDLVSAVAKKAPKPVKKKAVEEKSIAFQITLPEPELIEDLVFVRWDKNKEIRIKPESDDHKTYTINLKVSEKDTVYGMFYCEKYHVIVKFRETNLFKLKNGRVNFASLRLFENREDYYYSGHLMTNTKQPFKQEKPGYYYLQWTVPGHCSDRKKYNDDIKHYLNLLGYSGPILYEPDRQKASKLEFRLKHSEYHITMSIIDWYHSISPQGWGGGYKAYQNKFIITFQKNVSKDWVNAFFKKYQIANYIKGSQIIDYSRNIRQTVYHFKFNNIVNRAYMRVLDRMWLKKEVLNIKQQKYGAADLD